MSNQINSQTLGFSDTVQVTDSTQVMMCKLVMRVPHCQQQNANRVLQMQAALKSSCLNADTIALNYGSNLNTNQKPHVSKLTV